MDVTFYNEGSPNNGGASFIPWRGTSDNYTVPTLDYATFVQNAIQFHKPEKVIMKIDIEASEFTVIPQMIERDVFCNIDLAFIEWHLEMYAGASEKNDGRDIIERLHSIQRRGECRGYNFSDLDEESYESSKWDGGPFCLC